MITRLRSRLTYSNVISSLALFAALSGVAVAAGLPKNSVGTKQLKREAVTPVKLRKGAVTSQKIAPGAVIAGKLSANAVGTGNLGNGVVTSAKLAKGSVTNPAIANGVVGTNKLGSEVVTTAKLGKGSVTAAKLDSEIGTLLGTLKTGQTLRGVFDVGAAAKDPGNLARGNISFPFPLLNAATVKVLKKGETSANCSGLSGGNGQTPQATAGNLCVYITEEGNLDATTPLAVENNTRLGVGLVAKADEVGDYFAYGQWAVTAP